MFKYSTRLDKSAKKPSAGNFWNFSFPEINIKAAIKSGIATALSLYIGIWVSKLQNRPDTLLSGLWCVVSAIVVLQAHLGGTYKAAWQRFLGVLIGSILGCLSASQFGSTPFSLGIAVAITVVLCSLFRLQESTRIACLTVAVIMVFFNVHPEANLWQFGMYRFLDSCLGIFIAVVVAHGLWPAEAMTKIQHNTAKILSLLSKLFHMAIDLEPDRDRLDKLFFTLKEEVSQNLEEISDYFDEAKLELAMRQTNLEDWKELFNSVESTFDAIITLKQLEKSKLVLILDDSILGRLKAFSDASETSLLQLSTDLDSKKKELDPDIKTDLSVTYNQLKEDLIRFRGTRATRQLEWKEIESFFVFFYSLGMVAEEIFDMQSLIPKI